MLKALITAHSGCEDTARDSMASIERALALGADAIEVDVRVDSNGDLRISHNEVTQAEYNNKPLFTDILEMIRDTELQLNCDVKEPAALYLLLAEAKRYGFGRDRLILTGCVSPEQLIRDEFILKRARVIMNIEEVVKLIFIYHSDEFSLDMFYDLFNHPQDYLKGLFENGVIDEYEEDAVSILKACKVDGCNMPWAMLYMPIVQALKDARIPISVWTVDDADVAADCVTTGVWNITTRRVKQAMDVRQGEESKA